MESTVEHMKNKTRFINPNINHNSNFSTFNSPRDRQIIKEIQQTQNQSASARKDFTNVRPVGSPAPNQVRKCPIARKKDETNKVKQTAQPRYKPDGTKMTQAEIDEANREEAEKKKLEEAKKA